MLLRHRQKPAVKPFDPLTQIPVLHCSICNGEQVAGFRDKATGHFEEIMLIRNDADLDQFKEMYGIKNLAKEY